MIKDTMDKKFGPAWQVIVGKGFSYEVNYEVGYRLPYWTTIIAH